MAKREEMALTGQPELLKVGMWESNRKGEKILTQLLAEQTWLLPSNPTHAPELGKVGRGKPSLTGSQPFIGRRQKQCNTKSAGLFTAPAAPSPWFYLLLTLPVPDYMGMKLSLRFSASQWHFVENIILKKENFKIKYAELCPLSPSGRDLPFRNVRSERDFARKSPAHPLIHSAIHNPYTVTVKNWKRNFAKAPHSPRKGWISALDVVLSGNYIN